MFMAHLPSYDPPWRGWRIPISVDPADASVVARAVPLELIRHRVDHGVVRAKTEYIRMHEDERRGRPSALGSYGLADRVALREAIATTICAGVA